MSEITKWQMFEFESIPEYPDGVIHIKEDTTTQCPVGMLPLPLGKHQRGTERQRRNAKLIVAAPDLLYACQQALTNPFNNYVYKLMLDAVKKATDVDMSHTEIPDDKKWVCEECGSTQIEHKVWLDANTSVFKTDCEEDNDDNWCNNCEEHTGIILLSNFKIKLEEWWCNLNDTAKNKIAETHEEMKADSARWGNLDFEIKRWIWIKETEKAVK